MRTKNRAPGLRIVGGTAYGSTAVGIPTTASSEPVSRHPEPTRNSDDQPLTETARNGRLRKERFEIWRAAEAATRYWRLRLDFESALSHAQNMEIPEGRYHPVVDHKDRYPMVGKWREALVRQLLTPAPDTRSVAWKQMTLASRRYRYVKSEQIERAIADDLAFLAAHPVRWPMTKAAKKKPARKPSTKAADGEIEAKRAKAYREMEPHLCDCQRWTYLADVLSLDHDRPLYDMVVRHAAEKMEKLLEAYYEMGGYER
jgi:hypothetical protein